LVCQPEEFLSFRPEAGLDLGGLGEKQKINFSTVFAGQAVGIREVHDDIWLVSFMDYDLGYFDLETRVLEPLDPRLLPM
jgi:putative transposase